MCYTNFISLIYTGNVFLFRQKRFLHFGILCVCHEICVATNGVMRFSVCGSVWNYTLFLFSSERRKDCFLICEKPRIPI